MKRVLWSACKCKITAATALVQTGAYVPAIGLEAADARNVLEPCRESRIEQLLENLGKNRVRLFNPWVVGTRFEPTCESRFDGIQRREGAGRATCDSRREKIVDDEMAPRHRRIVGRPKFARPGFEPSKVDQRPLVAGVRKSANHKHAGPTAKNGGPM